MPRMGTASAAELLHSPLVELSSKMVRMACMEDLAQIKQMYHFTDARNLPVIKEHGGILSSKLLREKGIEVHPRWTPKSNH